MSHSFIHAACKSKHKFEHTHTHTKKETNGIKQIGFSKLNTTCLTLGYQPEVTMEKMPLPLQQKNPWLQQQPLGYLLVCKYCKGKLLQWKLEVAFEDVCAKIFWQWFFFYKTFAAARLWVIFVINPMGGHQLYFKEIRYLKGHPTFEQSVFLDMSPMSVSLKILQLNL